MIILGSDPVNSVFSTTRSVEIEAQKFSIHMSLSSYYCTIVSHVTTQKHKTHVADVIPGVHEAGFILCSR